MTNHPRYSPPPPPGRRPGVPEQRGTRILRCRSGPILDQQQPYDWRYQTQQQQQRSGTLEPHYDPYRGAARNCALSPGSVCRRQPPQKRSRAGALTAGALAVAMVSAGIGGGVALLAQPDPARSNVERHGAAPRHACRERACRLGRAGRGQGGSQRRQARGRPRQAIRRGLRDHPVLGRPHLDEQSRRHGGQGGPAGPGGPAAQGWSRRRADQSARFADGRSAPFTVVGTDPSSDIAVVRAEGCRA